MRKAFAKYESVNVLIAAACFVVCLFNAVLVFRAARLAVNENPVAAFFLSHFAGCEGLLDQWGSMSYTACFEDLQLWRVFTHIYLHAGVIHLAMNLAALLVVGKYVEKRVGAAAYAAVFHAVAVIDAVAVSFIYSSSESVGASAGIFGVIGIALVMCLKKELQSIKREAVYLLLFILISSVVGLESFVLHVLALILGTICGFVL